MRKELIWAGAVGITFGLAIAFGAWRINSSLKQKSIVATPTPDSVSDVKTSIALNGPENDDLVTTNTVTVSGITRPLDWTVFSGENGDTISQTGENGVFSQDVSLTSGKNQIKVTSINSKDNQTFQNVLVVYSSLFQINATPSATTSTATGDAGVTTGVEQKLAAALNQPKAYLGTVTDIADSTIQIKSLESQIEQVAVPNAGISVVNTKDSTSKTEKLSDVAIGDFIIAMGYINQKSVLTAQRILVTDPIFEPEIVSSLGKVTAVSKNTLTVTDLKTGEESTLTPDKNTNLESYSQSKTSSLKITAVNVGDTVISVEDNSGTPAILRSIFDLGVPQG